MHTTIVRPIAGPESDPDPPPVAPACRPCRGRGWVYCNSRDDAPPDRVECIRCRGAGVPAPFDRHAHCIGIAAGGGTRTAALYGSQHFRQLGRAGAQTTIARHGYAYFAGLVQRKGWSGPRTPDLAADLAVGQMLAEAA